MSAYSQYVKRIEGKLKIYDHFQNRNLEMLKNSLDLSIAYGELFELFMETKDERVDNAMKKMSKAMEAYDTMYGQYAHAITGFWELREQVAKMGQIILEYEAQEEEFKREI